MYHNTELITNGRPPKNTSYEHIYDRPISPSTYFRDPRKVDRPSSSSSIRAAFDDHIKSDHNVNVSIFRVDRKWKFFGGKCWFTNVRWSTLLMTFFIFVTRWFYFIYYLIFYYDVFDLLLLVFKAFFNFIVYSVV